MDINSAISGRRAAQDLMLAAYGAGLGSCWIVFAQSFLNTIDGTKILDLSDACAPIAPIIVGYPKTAVPAVTRKGSIIRWVG